MLPEVPEDLYLEANELYEEAEASLMAIDKGEGYDEHFNSIFRAFHSIKGAAGMFGLDDLQAHMHHLESYFEKTKSAGPMKSSFVDYFLSGIDAAKKRLEGENIVFQTKEFEELSKGESSAQKRPDDEKNEAVEKKDIRPEKPAEKPAEKPVKKTENQKHVPSKPLIFVVDDEKDVLEYFELLLSEKEYQVLAFDDPLKLLNELNQEHLPDLVISDFKMPQMDGLKLMESIHEKFKLLPVMLVSGFVTKEIALDAISQGVSNVIEKPVKPDMFFKSIEMAVDRYRSIKMLNKSIKLIMYQFSNLDDYLESKGEESIRKTIKEELKILLEEKKKILG